MVALRTRQRAARQPSQSLLGGQRHCLEVHSNPLVEGLRLLVDRGRHGQDGALVDVWGGEEGAKELVVEFASLVVAEAPHGATDSES